MMKHHAKAIDASALLPHHRPPLPEQALRDVTRATPRVHLTRALTDAELRVVASAVHVPRRTVAARLWRAMSKGWAAMWAAWDEV